MKVGLPHSLLYPKYHVFAKAFLEEMGAEIVVSPETNKAILDQGIHCCVDEACLPVKVFHGHVEWLRDRCEAILVPRFIGLKEKQFICPMFCGLIEMLSNSIPDLPPLIDAPIYSTDRERLLEWAILTSHAINNSEDVAERALNAAIAKHRDFTPGYNDEQYPLRVGLIGHTYNINDRFVNMDLIKKLNNLGVGVTTQEYVDGENIEREIEKLFKRPFWSLGRGYYGAAAGMSKSASVDGIIYISSFSCGIDSVIAELVKLELGDFPLMILKLDEHTGEAGYNTRLEAFADMLKRRS